MKKIKLGDIGVLLNGESIPSENGIYPAYGGNGIIKHVSSYNYDGNVIAIGRVGAQCGVVHYCAEKCWITDNCLCFQPNENFNPYYVYYLLKLLNLNKFHIGSAQPLITQPIIKNITCDLLPRETQDKIAALLSALDNKIALNKKINATLESMAKTLYDYWFVQFDFPDENGKPYKTNGGKMTYNSELGRDIPAGWEIETLEGKISITRGISYSTETLSAGTEGMPMINLASVDRKRNYIPSGLKFFIGDVPNEKKLQARDMLIACTDLTRQAEIIGSPILVMNDREYTFSMDLAKLTVTRGCW